MNNNQPVIAVVDDEEAICKGLERLLRSAGYIAKTFMKGPDFLRVVENEPLDCLIMDLNMMPMNGLSVMDRLAGMGRKLPIIVITGDDNDEIYERAMSKGIVAYLHKPIDDQVLLDTIEKAIGRRV
jgi:FixJ family two-component response regulator